MTPQGATELDYQARLEREVEEQSITIQGLKDELAEAKAQNGEAKHRKPTGWASGRESIEGRSVTHPCPVKHDPRPLV